MTATSEEMHAAILYHCSFEPLIDIDRFISSRGIGYIMQQPTHFGFWTIQPRSSQTSLQQFELKAAEIAIFKFVQRESYSDEVAEQTTEPFWTGVDREMQFDLPSYADVRR